MPTTHVGGLDRQIFSFLNGLAHKSGVLDVFWILLAKYAIFIFALFLLYLFYKDRKLVMRAILAAVLSAAIVALIKKVWFYPRPFLREGIQPLITHVSDSTFPSKHAAVAFALAQIIFLDKKSLGWWFLILAFFISLARVVTGVHYPSDILAGSLIGLIAATLLSGIIREKRQAS